MNKTCISYVISVEGIEKIHGYYSDCFSYYAVLYHRELIVNPRVMYNKYVRIRH